MRYSDPIRRAGWIALLVCGLVVLGCVTETAKPKKKGEGDVKKTIQALKDPKQAIVGVKDRELIEVQHLVMVKALGGLRDLDPVALDQTGWTAGLQAAQRINADPSLMSRGLRHELIDKQYRVRYCIKKGDQPTSGAQAAAAGQPDQPAAAGQTGKNATPAAKAQAQSGAPGQESTWLLVAVPATSVGMPLAQALPYAFVVKKLGLGYRIVMADFLPPDVMAGKTDEQILNEIFSEI